MARTNDPFASMGGLSSGGGGTSHWKVQFASAVTLAALAWLMGATWETAVGVLIITAVLLRAVHGGGGVKLERVGMAALGAVACTAFYLIPHVGPWVQGNVAQSAGIGGPIVEGVKAHGWSWDAPQGPTFATPTPTPTTTVPAPTVTVTIPAPPGQAAQAR